LAASAVFVLAAASLGTWPLLLALPVLTVLLGYSWTKRFTWGSHLFLGLALALAPGGAWIAMGAAPEPAIVALMVAVLTWVSGFDVLYSLQDEHFDREHGLYSIPARFGTGGAVVISAALHVLTVFALVLCGVWLARGSAFFVGIAVIAALLVYEHALVGRGNLAKIDRAFFDINGYVSVAFFALTALDAWLGRALPSEQRCRSELRDRGCADCGRRYRDRDSGCRPSRRCGPPPWRRASRGRAPR